MIYYLLSGLLTYFIFPTWNLFGLSFFCLIPTLFDISAHDQRLTKIVLKGYVYGVMLMGLYHLWFFKLKPFASYGGIFCAWLAYSLYLGLFYALCFLIIGSLKKRLPMLLLVPSAWVICEWLRSLGPLGNTDGVIGYSQTHFVSLLQFASLGGVYLISFILVLINMLILYAIQYRKAKYVAYLFGVFMIIFIGGQFLLKTNIQHHTKIPVAALQTTHAQQDKLTQSKHPQIYKNILDLSKKALSKKPAIIFWPETISPSLNLQKRRLIAPLANVTKTEDISVVFGTPTKNDTKYHNSITVYTPDGLLNQTYKKIQLMPFGEYWPLRSVFVSLGLKKFLPAADFSPGKMDQPLIQLNNITFSNLICLESIYPNLCRKQILKGADFINVAANNAWFFDASTGEKHFQMSRLRAVENNRFLVQSANNGVAGIVDNKGRIIKKGVLNTESILDGNIHIGLSNSIYLLLGDWIILVAFIVLLFGGISRLSVNFTNQ